MANPGVSERSKIDSFIVMDLMRDAAAKQRQLEESGMNFIHESDHMCKICMRLRDGQIFIQFLSACGKIFPYAEEFVFCELIVYLCLHSDGPLKLMDAGSDQRVLHLEVGQPSTGAPGPVKEAAAKALQVLDSVPGCMR